MSIQKSQDNNEVYLKFIWYGPCSRGSGMGLAGGHFQVFGETGLVSQIPSENL